MPFVQRSLFILIACQLLVSQPHAQEAAKKPVSGDIISLSVTQYANMALKNSLRSRTAEQNLASSRYGWQITRRGLTWPTLSASASGQKTYSDTDTGTTSDTRNNDASLNLSQPLLSGTKLTVGGAWSRSETETELMDPSSPTLTTTALTRYSPVWIAGFTQPIFIFTGNESLRSRRQSNLQWENDQDAYWRERLAIEFDARVLYYDLLLQSETAAVQRKKLESSKLVNDTTRALVRAGKLAEVELVRADIRSRKDEREIQNAQNTLEKRMNNAKDLISLPQNQEIRLASTLAYKPFTIPLDRLTRAATENNPDIQTAKRQVESAEIDYKRTKENDHPQFNASGAYALTQDRSDETLPIDPYTWNLRVGMDWPIFDASQSRLRKRQGKISLDNIRRDFENQLRQLHVAVENAYLEIIRTEEQIADFGPQRESAERNVRAIRLQYRNGLTRLTDVFDAENQMRDLDLEYLSLLVSFNTARDRLKTLIGVDLADLEKGG